MSSQNSRRFTFEEIESAGRGLRFKVMVEIEDSDVESFIPNPGLDEDVVREISLGFMARPGFVIREFENLGNGRWKVHVGPPERLQSEPDELIDSLLETLIPCNSELEYQRAREQAGDNPKNVESMLYRRATGRVVYPGPASMASRTTRVGAPWSFAEGKILDWASTALENIGYLGLLLQRTDEEVKAEIKRRSEEVMGVKGFNI